MTLLKDSIPVNAQSVTVTLLAHPGEGREDVLHKRKDAEDQDRQPEGRAAIGGCETATDEGGEREQDEQNHGLPPTQAIGREPYYVNSPIFDEHKCEAVI